MRYWALAIIIAAAGGLACAEVIKPSLITVNLPPTVELEDGSAYICHHEGKKMFCVPIDDAIIHPLTPFPDKPTEPPPKT